MSFLDQVEKETRSIMSGELSTPFTITYTEDSQLVTVDGRGIFDRTYTEVDPETGGLIMSKNSRITIAKNEFEDVAHKLVTDDLADDWRVEIEGRNYRLKHGEEHDASTITLYLKNA